jgi:hypothetical protein
LTRTNPLPLHDLAVILIQAGWFEQAHASIDAITDGDERITALSTLTYAIAQAGHVPQYTALLSNIWRQAHTRNELLKLFTIDDALLRAYPELGQKFLDSFAWVDAQLAAS